VETTVFRSFVKNKKEIENENMEIDKYGTQPYKQHGRVKRDKY